MADTPVRWQKKTASYELTWLRWIFVNLIRLFTWGLRRCKPLMYHPLAWPGIIVFCWALMAGLMLALYLLLVGFLAGLMWYAWAPSSFDKHAKPRLLGFMMGWYYRYRPRYKLTECHVLAQSNPVPVISRVRVHGPIHKVWIKMSAGDDIELWRNWATNIAQTYGAGDAKVNLYRPPTKLSGWQLYWNGGRIQLRHGGEKTDKWRWLEIEFLHKNPFTKTVGHEFIDYHRNAGLALEQGNPVGRRIDGSPYRLNVERHLLVFAMTQWGKSNAERTMVYADHEDVAAGRLENWMIDLKRGVEAATMESQLARYEYGISGAEQVLRFVLELQIVMDRRLDQMRTEGVTHYWELKDPKKRRKIKLYVDEWLSFEEPEYAQVKGHIYKTFAGILNRGAAAGIQVIAFAQQPKKDKFELRDYFNEVWVGAMKTRAQVAMATDGDAWERGMRANDLPMDARGVFYVEVEQGRVPEMTRIALTPAHVTRDLPKCPKSAFWPISAPYQGHFPTKPPMPEDSLTAIPAAPESVEKQEAEPEPEREPEREPELVGRLTDL